MVYKSAQIFLPFCHNPHEWRTDRRTDRILIARPRLHSMQRGKNDTVFWQCWRSMFESNPSCKLIESCVDADVIAAKFTSHFTSVFSCNDHQKANSNSIKQYYITSWTNYYRLPLNENHNMDTKLVSTVVSDIAHGKANGLSAKHLYYCHSSLCVILSKNVSINVNMLLCTSWI